MMRIRNHALKATLQGAALIGIVVAGSPARADDAAACDAGIDMITAELAKQQPDKTAAVLKKSLKVANREKGEQEYDECLDAVADAKKALGN